MNTLIKLIDREFQAALDGMRRENELLAQALRDGLFYRAGKAPGDIIGLTWSSSKNHHRR